MKYIYLISFIAFLGCQQTSNQNENQSNDSTRIYIDEFGNKKSNTLHWLHSKDYKLIKQLKEIYLVNFTVRGAGEVYWLGIRHIPENSSWQKIETLINQLKGLKWLYLETKGVRSLNFKSLNRLQELVVRKTKQLPDKLVLPPLVKQLKSLHIQQTNVKQVVFPAQSSRIEYLFLDRNQITRLGASYGYLKKLKKLLMFRNNVQQIDNALAQIKTLEVLELSDNQLTSFDLVFPQLKELSLSDNPLKDTTSIKKAYPNTDVVF